jgi:hypothetical protein
MKRPGTMLKMLQEQLGKHMERMNKNEIYGPGNPWI